MSATGVGTKWMVYDSIYLEHLTGLRHPEKPKRCEAIMQALLDAGVTDAAHIIKPRRATPEEISFCHPLNYYNLVAEEVQRADPSGKTMLSTGDAQICPRSLDAALFAAGGVMVAIDKVMTGVAQNVFCNVRPPGHHACSDRGMGFCLFNNVAIGARYVQRMYWGIERVLIVDWDVHHGNGTQDIFYNDPSVFYFSTHQDDFYPGTGSSEETGEGAAAGTTLNVPIPAGKGARELVLKAFYERLVPAMEKFQPQFVFISAGFDAHQSDTLGSFDLTDKDFVELTAIVKGIADKYAQGRIVSVLEGGYNIEALKSAVTAHVSALA